MPNINDVARSVARRRQLEAEQLKARELRAVEEMEKILDLSEGLAMASFKLRFMLAQVDAVLATVAKLSASNANVDDVTTGALIESFDLVEKAFPTVMDALERDIKAEVVSVDTCDCAKSDGASMNAGRRQV